MEGRGVLVPVVVLLCDVSVGKQEEEEEEERSRYFDGMQTYMNH